MSDAAWHAACSPRVMFRNGSVNARLCAALIAAWSLSACDGPAHGTDLYGGTSGSGSSASDPNRTCNVDTQPGAACPWTGEGTCYANSGTLICVNGRWGVDRTTIDFPPPPPPPPPCPAAEPADGEPCHRPTNSGCSYSTGSPDSCSDRQFGSHSYRCTPDGKWQRQAREAERVSCPLIQPWSGLSCAECVGRYPAECTYSSGICATAVFSCDPYSLTWQQIPSPCLPPQDAGAGP